MAVIFITAVSYAQPQSNPSYNFTRAIEEFKKGSKTEAMDYLTKELNDNPNNGYAYMTVAILQTDAGNYSEALNSINIAIKKLPKKDKEFTGQAYACRAHLYGISGDTVAALADYNRAVSLNPEEEETVEVPFTPDGGCVSVRCSINDLPRKFIFDTGASTVSLSQVEANFMLKNGYLKPDDIVGSGRFVDANGDVSEGTIVNLRNVGFGGLKLNNVRVSVVRNQRAPLLLGQSVLGRLGSIEIVNASKKLIIKGNK